MIKMTNYLFIVVFMKWIKLTKIIVSQQNNGKIIPP